MGVLEETLVRAVKRGDLEGVRSALQAGADPRTVATRRRLPPLHLAAEQGHAHVVKYLLEHGFPVDSPHPSPASMDGMFRQMTPLHFAAEKGRAEAVLVLLQAGADPNRPAPGFFNYRPLHMTAWWELTNRLVETAALLLEYGADPELRDDRGKSVWDLVTEREETELVQEFLQLRERLAAPPPTGKTSSVASVPAPRNVPPPSRTPVTQKAGKQVREELFRAASRGDLSVYQAARTAGTDLHQPLTASGDTALIVAAGEGHVGLLEFLIREGAPLAAARPDGTTALHAAVRREQESAVSRLLTHGAPPSGADEQGFHPLHHLARSHSPAARSIARLLVNHGADVNQQADDCDRWPLRTSGTPLHMAAAEGHPLMISALLELGADPNAFNSLGQTPVLGAIATIRSLGRPAEDPGDEPRVCCALKILLNHRAGINLPHEITGWTPLHEAARRDAAVVMRFLLSHGADPNLPDRHGRLPLHHLLDEEAFATRLQALQLDAKPQLRARAEAELRRQKAAMYHLLREFGSQG